MNIYIYICICICIYIYIYLFDGVEGAGEGGHAAEGECVVVGAPPHHGAQHLPPTNIPEESIQKQLLRSNVKRFRRGLVFEALRRLYHSTLGLLVIKKKKKIQVRGSPVEKRRRGSLRSTPSRGTAPARWKGDVY